MKNNEDILQSEIVKWYNNSYCLKFQNPRGVIFSVPNGGNRNKIEAMKFKATGLLAGVSDLIVILPNGILLFIEIKTDFGNQQPNQIDFQNLVTALGFHYHIIRSLEQFKELIHETQTRGQTDQT
jgi:hypothetical protein